MIALLFALALPCRLDLSGGAASLRFETPGPGSYQVASTSDFARWRIEACGYVTVASYVTARMPEHGMAFYVVAFEPK